MKAPTFLFLLLLSLFVIACGGEDTSNSETVETETGTPAEEPPKPEYKLSDFSESPTFGDATLASMDYKEGTFNFGVENYELAAQTEDAPTKMCANSAKGQHIHLIVNDSPYAAKYEASFAHDVADGDHHILAFLSRSYHESIKNGNAHIAKKVTVANKSITASEDITTPMLFYSRPKGTYVGEDTKKLMLDFFLVNADLGADYKVKVEINGDKAFTVDAWKPYFLEGLPMGDNKVKLTLLDKDGNAVNTPLNPVERVFTLKEDPAPAN